MKLLSTKRRRLIVGGLVVVLIPVLALAWWLGSPLFIDKTVDEEFPLTVGADIPEGMSRSEAETIMEGMAMMDSPMTESMMDDEATAMVVKSGSFRDADSFHTGSGQATIYKLADGEHVLRVEDLRVTNGPDLRVLLSAHPDPMNRGEFNSEDYVELDKLKGNIGNQNYPIPELDLSQYRSVVIYCKPFHVIFSVAPLS